MSSPNLASAAAASPSRVRFDLVSPSIGRPRRASLPYPKVAQSKGSADRKYSFDLFWEPHTLSAVSSVAPIDSTQGPQSAKEEEKADSETHTTPRKSRPQHSYIVLSRKQTAALLESEDPKDRRLQELLRTRRD